MTPKLWRYVRGKPAELATPEPFWLWRYVRGRPVELVAIIHDAEMASTWVNRAPVGQRRRWTRFDVARHDRPE